jgi:succinate-semialdehyde dehydrogenase/glutarate-semialdehyde dehydrogenase
LITESALLEKLPADCSSAGSGSTAPRHVPRHDPATGDTLVEIADASPEDGIRALDAAVAAQDAWAATPARTRSDILRRAFDLLTERADEFALLMTLEMGKPLAEARGEVTYGGEFLRWFSEEAVRIAGRYGSNPEGTGRMVVSQRPSRASSSRRGTSRSRWRPARSPRARRRLHRRRQAAGAHAAHDARVRRAARRGGPARRCRQRRDHDDLGALSAPIIADPRLRKLSFTGSTPVGKKLIAQAAEGVLRVSMELGGNAPFVVFDDADLDKAVDGAMAAKFRNIGQACTAANRFIVHASSPRSSPPGHRAREGDEDRPRHRGGRADRPAHRPQGRRGHGGARLGCRRARRDLLAGGSAIEGPTFFEPTVITDVAAAATSSARRSSARCSRSRRSDEDEAVRLANDTEYGLVSYVFTEDLARGMRMIDRLETGMMGLNAASSPTRRHRSAASSSRASAARAASRASTSTCRPSTR